MPILLQDDIDFYYSGGATNLSPKKSIGGDISNYKLPNHCLLFDDFFPFALGEDADPLPTIKDYRVIFVKIAEGSNRTGSGGKLWLLPNNETVPSISYRMGIGDINAPFEMLVDDKTPPVSVALIDAPSDNLTAIDLPDVNAGDYFSIVIERTISQTTLYQYNKGPTISVSWDDIIDSANNSGMAMGGGMFNFITYTDISDAPPEEPEEPPIDDYESQAMGGGMFNFITYDE